MALRKRGGIWHIDLMHDGARIRESTKTGDRKLAEVRHAELQAALFRGTFIPSKAGGVGGSYTVAKAFDRAYEGAWLLDASEMTKRAARDQMTQLAASGYLDADTPVTALDQHALERIQRGLVDSGISRATVNRRFWVVRAILDQARKDGAIKALPEIPRNLREDTKHRRAMTAEEEIAVLEYLSTEDALADLRDVFVILMDTGFRLAEAANLTRREVDFEHRAVHALRTKNGEARAVPMTSRVESILRRRLDARDAVFPVPAGWSPRYWLFRFDKDWAKVRASLGMGDVVLHCTRHTAGTRLMASGFDVRTVMDFLGHKTPTMALRYSHGVNERIREASSALETFAQRRSAQKTAQEGGE